MKNPIILMAALPGVSMQEIAGASSTGESFRASSRERSLSEAERLLAHMTEQVRRTEIYGMRPQRTFADATVKYLEESEKASLWVDALQIRLLRPFIENLPLEAIHMGSLHGIIEARKAQGAKNRTINYGFQTVRHILNMAAAEWIDANGMTWLASPPRIKFLPERDKRKPYPLSWKEQEKLFADLPADPARMATFKVNAGTREGEVCSLLWEWERVYPTLNTSVFVIPGEPVKNRDDRVVVLNRTARAVIEQVRGEHPEYVFSYKGRGVSLMYGRAWRKPRDKAVLPEVRVRDLKHSYGRRSCTAEVPEEDRKDVLGHRSGKSVTTYYSEAEILKLIEYSNRVCRDDRHKSDTIVFLEKKNRHGLSSQAGGVSR